MLVGKACALCFFGWNGGGIGSGGTCMQTSMISPNVGFGLLGRDAMACLHAVVELDLSKDIKVSLLDSGFSISLSKTVCSLLANWEIFSPGRCNMEAHC